MQRQVWIAIVILTAAVGLSLFKTHAPSLGETYLHQLEAVHASLRAAAVIYDYIADDTTVTRAATDIEERGDGSPFADPLGRNPDAERHWIRTADAIFSWRPPAIALLHDELRIAADRLAGALANGPLDDATGRALTPTVLASLDHLTDEQRLLAWLAADRGVLASDTERTAAIRESLLLLVPGGDGPALTFHVADHTIYVLPEEPTADAQWCAMHGFDATGKSLWTARLRVKKSVTPERVRTLVALFAREARSTTSPPQFEVGRAGFSNTGGTPVPLF